MQTASTNIFERIGHSQELIEFKRGTEIGCLLCKKSIHEISLLLKKSTVNCQWNYNKVEATRNNSNSAMKSYAT
ncbi:unnamed protein product [Staurois parvus]|uniref:Uncharacterized protein n=1 Tax=Staurois parvus TaxID=386267 RepID=A0ABN9EES3_9NEOB|nr:unnamed protein product [Staurois parvus]